ncbi:MAG: formylglycine-generating enzyme family protein [Cryomorphaceae bacterium]|jgi:formylglycine-generating enzyme required for sulfatase activity|nr:MAG: formylglycine-generating enzyme family protein [Cryomorphaceae bacterium]|tara:strand:+ start:2225 stop:3187 length:963 start_codon:yes stop_codon:yes gene_type:complete
MKFIFYLLLFYSFFGIAQNNLFQPYNQKIIGNNYNLEMIPINGGDFLMGSPSNEKNRMADEGPVHRVRLEPFWMAKYETTWDLYHLFMNRNIDENQPDFNSQNEVNIEVDGVSGATTPYVEMSFGMGTDGYPAISMTQLAAKKFCKWLSAMTGNFYRLPTEAEWEYACRAGTNSAFSFGDDLSLLDDYAWFKNNSDESYHKVGLKKPNPWGLFDMHGNISEWTLDMHDVRAYQKYSGTLADNPYEKPTKLYPRVVRGGSWMNSDFKLRSASRQVSSKQWKKQDPQIPRSIWWHTDAQFVGFRIIRPLKTPSLSEQEAYWK